MKTSAVQGQLLSFNSEQNTIRVMDREDREVITLEIASDVFPSSMYWDD